MAKKANDKKAEAYKVNTTLAVKATFATLEALSDSATRACGFGVSVLTADNEGKQRDGVHTGCVAVYAASQYGKSKHACTGNFKEGHARILISQACTMAEALELVAKGIYTLKFHKPIKGSKSLEPIKVDTFTGKQVDGTVGSKEWKWARALIANDTGRISKMYWVSLAVSTSEKRDATKAAEAAKKAESQKGMSAAEKKLADFQAANKVPKCGWTLDGRKMTKLPHDELVLIQATYKGMGKRIVINTEDETKAKAYQEALTPLEQKASEALNRKAGEGEQQATSGVRKSLKRANVIAGAKATPSTRAEGESRRREVKINKKQTAKAS